MRVDGYVTLGLLRITYSQRKCASHSDSYVYREGNAPAERTISIDGNLSAVCRGEELVSQKLRSAHAMNAAVGSYATPAGAYGPAGDGNPAAMQGYRYGANAAANYATQAAYAPRHASSSASYYQPMSDVSIVLGAHKINKIFHG